LKCNEKLLKEHQLMADASVYFSIGVSPVNMHPITREEGNVKKRRPDPEDEKHTTPPLMFQVSHIHNAVSCMRVRRLLHVNSYLDVKVTQRLEVALRQVQAPLSLGLFVPSQLPILEEFAAVADMTSEAMVTASAALLRRILSPSAPRHG
jgi:hypothetical protein